ncbi:MAG TPA: glycerophosphodiester phosphodiesterase [Gemmatimonadaceae bacterium]|nr:glycerophosphodiester phosphodiesterase [Gemmatimonadaceae bacterium]
MNSGRPASISHRGAHDSLPENSIAAFNRAIALGAAAIELDVHATRDGVLVVHHDAVLKPAAGRAEPARRIADLAGADLDDYLLADGRRPPTLNEALAEIGTRAFVYVEIKAESIEPLVVRALRESACLAAIHSFDHRIAQRVKQLMPAMRTGVLQVARPLDPVAAALAAGADDLWQHTDYIDEELVVRAHDAGLSVIAWTVNDPARWEELGDIGVDGICTDLIGKLAERGAGPR